MPPAYEPPLLIEVETDSAEEDTVVRLTPSVYTLLSMLEQHAARSRRTAADGVIEFTMGEPPHAIRMHFSAVMWALYVRAKRRRAGGNAG